MGRNAKIGDVIEIVTQCGLAYAQVTHKDKTLGTLIRVLPGCFPERPHDLKLTVVSKSIWHAFFPVNAAVQRKIFEIVGNFAIPECDAMFPLLRNGVILRKGNSADSVWYLYDGVKEWRAETLPPDFDSLSFEEAINDTLLIERIERNWRPKDELV